MSLLFYCFSSSSLSLSLIISCYKSCSFSLYLTDSSSNSWNSLSEFYRKCLGLYFIYFCIHSFLSTISCCFTVSSGVSFGRQSLLFSLWVYLSIRRCYAAPWLSLLPVANIFSNWSKIMSWLSFDSMLFAILQCLPVLAQVKMSLDIGSHLLANLYFSLSFW